MRSLNPSPDLHGLLARVRRPSATPADGPVGNGTLAVKPHVLIRAACILGAGILSTILRYWLGRRFGVTAQYVTYFPSVLLIASIFGVEDGIWATLVSAVMETYFFLPPVHTFRIGSTGDRVGLLIFSSASIGVSLIAGALRSRTWRMYQALEDLRTSEERFFAERRRLFETNLRMATIVESAEEAIIGKDPNGIVTSWNAGAETIFGYSAAEIIGQPIRILLPSGRESEEEEILASVLRGESVAVPDATRLAKDGHAVHVSLHVSPIRDESGNVVGACKVAHDITETLKLQRQLQQSQKMEAIGQLAGGIAHDFNNLLAIVLGALELQRTAILDNPDALQRWEVANRAAMRGAELTRRLLAFSSVEHFKVASTGLNHTLRNTMEMATRLLGPEITVDLKLEPDIAAVFVDPAGLESAILNLVINARDAMQPQGGRLTVNTRTAVLDETFTQTLSGNVAPGRYAGVSVTDTGSGMSQDVLDRACEPFFTTKERGRGTGLGLSMVYGFVKHSGGGIRIYSEVGYGTTVTLYLPFDRRQEKSVPKEQSRTATSRRSGSVLCVDDESELLELSVTYLRSRGYTVYAAENAAVALDLLQQHNPIDVLVTDIVMGGGMDGMQLAEKVRSTSPLTRIIYSSGFPADAMSERSLPLADSLVLQKPYSLSELAASVDHALGVRQILSVGVGGASADNIHVGAASGPFN